MKANTIAYAQIFGSGLDKQIVQESTTGWMEANSNLVKYNGGNEVKLPNILMDGLADYDRASGFKDGAVTLEWKTYELTQDRGRTFSIDAMDVDETNFELTAGAVLGEFQRTHVVPELDAYRYSKLATLAIEAEQTAVTAPTVDNIVSLLLADLANLEDEVGIKDVVITMSPITAGMLGTNGREYLSKAMLAKGEISIDVQTFNDNPIVKASSKVLKTEIEIKNDEAGGWVAGAGAKDINWLLTEKSAPIAICKTDKVRVFTPDVNQEADAYKVDLRKYHDLWVPESKRKSIFVNTKA